MVSTVLGLGFCANVTNRSITDIFLSSMRQFFGVGGRAARGARRLQTLSCCVALWRDKT